MNNKIAKLKRKKGFTLIELIIVIAIIGIIAAIAIPNFAKVQTNAKIDADIATGRAIANAVNVLEAQGDINISAAGNLDATQKGKVFAYLKDGTNLKFKMDPTVLVSTSTIAVDATGAVTNITATVLTVSSEFYATPTGKFVRQ